ncbi:alpha/beta hydrolase [Variovorax sp. J22P168]|uniref:alpha/beta hydrolase n=1 Tax=Variovorax jilinensis TaxID=3053513 RepID=UPI002575D9F7|nr:alpha/beta hydrolase [Variovorax sp. J22P168]MDM0014992.1 alpha/beta hydrolase [Variovorax sp. J22P168]
MKPRYPAVVLGVALLALLSACSPFRIVNGLVPSGTHQIEADIAYGPLPRQRLDIYRPLASRLPAGARPPLVVFFYGGNWSSGERADYRFVGEALAARGAVVAIADYRLSPEATYPSFVADSARAVAWAIGHAAALGADPGRVYVMGHSAGAYLAAMVALDPRWLAANDASPKQLAGWIGLAGPYDFLPIGDPKTRVAFDWPATPADSQPLAHASAASPRALLMVATHDRLVDPARNSGAMAQRLRAEGVEVTWRGFDDLSHVTLIGAVAGPFEWLGGPVLPPLLDFIGLKADAR